MSEQADVDTILGRLVAETGPDDIPDEAYDAAIRQVVDGIGVTLAASVLPAGDMLVDVATQIGGSGEARVIGSGFRTSAMMAGWANASLAHLLDFDDTGFSHPTACMLPVALAVGEATDATGREAMGALILGYEVFERLASSGRPHEPALRERGYHPTSIYGTPASAAVAAKLLGLDADGVQMAMSLSATSASGLSQQFGSWGKGLNAGNAAKSGILGALLAQRGYRGDPHGVGGDYGLLSAVVGKGHYNLDNVEIELGERWSIVDPGLGIKPYPCCTSNLRAIDATLAIRRAEGLAADDIEKIVVHVHPDLLHTLRFVSPEWGFAGKFSLDYTVAAAALDGELTVESFSDEAGLRPGLRAMIERTHFELHPEWPIEDRRNNPVEIHHRDGRVFEKEVPVEWGARANPLTWDEIADKYRGVAALALPEVRVERSLDAVKGLVGDTPVTAVMDELVVAP